MQLVTKALAVELESCIKQTHIEVTKQYPRGMSLAINGGAACFSGFDSYLSQVVGWGFLSQPRQFAAELKVIEDFYKLVNHKRVDIELCPYVGTDLAEFLSARGYGISELSTVSYLELSSYVPVDCGGGYEIRVMRPQEYALWVECVVMGFGFPEAREQFTRYISAKGIVVFGAFVEGKLVAGGTVSMQGDVCDLAVASTLPEFRGRGLQTGLLQARLGFARQMGMRLAAVTTSPGSVSELNCQGVGFRVAYNRVKMSLFRS